MKHKIFMSMIAGIALIFSACGNQDPVSPELTPGEQEGVLAKRSIKEFTATATICEVTPGVQSIVDNVLTVRDQIHYLIMESDDPRINGTQTALVNINVDLTTGAVTAWGKFSLEPENVDGAWKGGFFVQSIGGAPISGHSFGRGTGDLEGRKIYMEMQDVLPGPEPPCDIALPLPGAPKTQGSISGFIKR